MKNIFKKNSIIITALAIMIVIAGYLSFTSKDTKKEAGKVADTTMQGTDESGDFAEVDGTDVATGTGTDTTGTTTDTNTTDTTGTTTDTNTAGITGTPDTTTDTNTNETTKTSDELGDSDISDDDILAKSHEVTDNGDLNLEEGVPGEAVLANTADASYFVSAKIKREQARAKDKETYLQIIDSPDVTAEEKQPAIDSMLKLTDTIDKECAVEILLGARGFADAVVFIDDGTANVTVDAATLTEQQLAIIEDTVKDKTGIEPKNIEIMNVVVEE